MVVTVMIDLFCLLSTQPENLDHAVCFTQVPRYSAVIVNWGDNASVQFMS